MKEVKVPFVVYEKKDENKSALLIDGKEVGSVNGEAGEEAVSGAIKSWMKYDSACGSAKERIGIGAILLGLAALCLTSGIFKLHYLQNGKKKSIGDSTTEYAKDCFAKLDDSEDGSESE